MEDVKCAVWGFVHHCGKYLGPRLFDTLLQGHLVMQRDGGEDPGPAQSEGATRGDTRRRVAVNMVLSLSSWSPCLAWKL